MSGFAIAGSLLGIASIWLTGLANFIRILAIAILLILGFLSMFPQLSYLLIAKLPIPKFKEPNRINLTGEFLLGSQLQQLLIKPTTKRVAGRSPAIGFIFLFVAGLKANCCM